MANNNNENLENQRYGGAHTGSGRPAKGLVLLITITLTLSMAVSAVLSTQWETIKGWFKDQPGIEDVIDDPSVGGGEENPDQGNPNPDQGGNQGGQENPDQGTQVEVTYEQKVAAIAEKLFASKFGGTDRTVEVLNCYMNNDCSATFNGNEVDATKIIIEAKVNSKGKDMYKSSAITIDTTGYATVEDAIVAIYNKTVDDKGNVSLTAGGCKTTSVAQSSDINNYLTLTCNLSSEEAKNRINTMNENIKEFFKLSDDQTVIVTDAYREQRDSRGNGVFCLKVEVYDANGVLSGYKLVEIDQPYNFLNSEIYSALLGTHDVANARYTFDDVVYKGYTIDKAGNKTPVDPGIVVSR